MSKAVEFSVEEARALLALIDMAVKAGGLQVSEAATVLAKKVQVAAEPDAEPEA